MIDLLKTAVIIPAQNVIEVIDNYFLDLNAHLNNNGNQY